MKDSDKLIIILCVILFIMLLMLAILFERYTALINRLSLTNKCHCEYCIENNDIE